MKKFFKVLLLAAVALMPVMGMAQTVDSSQVKWEREMRMRQYEDSVASARQEQLDKHQKEMATIEQQSQITRMRTIWNEDMLLLIIVAIVTVTITVLYLRHSRRNAEDQKELIHKLIDKGMLNSTDSIGKDVIEAIMKPQKKEKSDKERYVNDATMLGVALGLFFAGVLMDSDIIVAAAWIISCLSVVRLIARKRITSKERKEAKEREYAEAMKAMQATKNEKIEEAEVVEEK